MAPVAVQPLPVRVVAVQTQKMKRIALADPTAQRQVRTKPRRAFGKLPRPGVLAGAESRAGTTRRVGLLA
jgi:hypothetical protein